MLIKMCFSVFLNSHGGVVVVLTAATTPPFSTTAMLELPMTRQLWMETCGE